MIWTQAIKSFIILAYYCYLHMRKLQLKKKPQSISSTKVSLVQLFQTVLLEKVEVLKSKIWNWGFFIFLFLFFKVACLVKTIKKCFLTKLSVWLILIKVAVWFINYQKRQDIYVLITSLYASYGHNIFSKISQ